jgi:hypothetical protein
MSVSRFIPTEAPRPASNEYQRVHCARGWLEPRGCDGSPALDWSNEATGSGLVIRRRFVIGERGLTVARSASRDWSACLLIWRSNPQAQRKPYVKNIVVQRILCDCCRGSPFFHIIGEAGDCTCRGRPADAL